LSLWAAHGCSKDSPAPSGEGESAQQAEPQAEGAGSGLKVGFIYVGPRDDYGYNQAHAEGAAAVAKIDGVTILEEEKVAETMDVQRTM
jgi:simple sugar transport system substrate-binding protein